MHRIARLSAAAALAVVLFFPWKNVDLPRPSEPRQAFSEWFFEQRAFPYGRIPQGAYRQALEQAHGLRRAAQARNAGAWELAGPINVGGRITSLAVHAEAPDTWYVGAASGGVFKTEDAGASWTAVFDDAASLSIGDVALAPSNPATVYVGTGETNGGGAAR